MTVQASAVEEYRRRAAQAIAEVERIPDPSLSDPGVKQRIAHVIEQSVERVSDGRAAEDSLTAESLARMLVDAGGPREPGHSTERAFQRLADLRTAIAFASPPESYMLTRRSLLNTPTASESVLKAWWASVRVAGVLVPTVETATEGRAGIPQVMAADGTAFIPVFTDEERSGAWASELDDGSRVAFRPIRLTDVASAASGARVGVAINPLNENLALSPSFVASQTNPDVVEGGTSLNLGRPASLPDGMESALQQWASAEPSVSHITVAQAVTQDGRQSLLLTVATVPPRSPEQLGEALHRVLPTGVRLDLVPDGTDLGRAVTATGTRLFARP